MAGGLFLRGRFLKLKCLVPLLCSPSPASSAPTLTRGDLRLIVSPFVRSNRSRPIARKRSHEGSTAPEIEGARLPTLARPQSRLYGPCHFAARQSPCPPPPCCLCQNS